MSQMPRPQFHARPLISPPAVPKSNLATPKGIVAEEHLMFKHRSQGGGIRPWLPSATRGQDEGTLPVCHSRL